MMGEKICIYVYVKLYDAFMVGMDEPINRDVKKKTAKVLMDKMRPILLEDKLMY